MPSGSRRGCPLEETSTGSTTRLREPPGRGQVGHHVDDASIGQHAGLDAAHVEVVEHGLDLQAHERRLERHDAADAGRVLGRHGGERAGAVHPVARRRS